MRKIKLLIIVLLSFNVNSQVLVIDINLPLHTVQIKHQEELQYVQMHEDNMFFEAKSFQIYFEESQIYDVIVNDGYFLTFKPTFLDDTLTTTDDIEVICHCSYEVVDNILVVTF